MVGKFSVFGVFADDYGNGGWFLLEFDARMLGVNFESTCAV